MTDPTSLGIPAGPFGELLSSGFEVVSESRLSSHGDTLLVLRRGSCEVLLGRDRGQSFITVRVPGTGLDYEVAIWESCVDREFPSLDVRGFNADVEVLIRRFSDIERTAKEGGQDLLDCLRDAGLRRFQERRERGLIQRPG
jgi:hypothetical protein